MSIKTVDLKQRFAWGEPFLRQMRERLGPRAIVAFSTGKDAVAMAIAMKPYFDELIPFSCYYVPGLSIMEEAVAYYEKHLFGRPIHRAPHPTLIEWLNEFRYQTPETAKTIAAAGLPATLSFAQIAREIAEDEGLPANHLYAVGARSGEFFTRAVMCSKSGGLQPQHKQWWPIWEMNRKDVLDTIKGSGLAISREYELFHSSFCGLDYGFMSQIKKHAPDDWQTVLEWFPLIEAEIWRFERQRAA